MGEDEGLAGFGRRGCLCRVSGLRVFGVVDLLKRLGLGLPFGDGVARETELVGAAFAIALIQEHVGTGGVEGPEAGAVLASLWWTIVVKADPEEAMVERHGVADGALPLLLAQLVIREDRGDPTVDLLLRVDTRFRVLQQLGHDRCVAEARLLVQVLLQRRDFNVPSLVVLPNFRRSDRRLLLPAAASIPGALFLDVGLDGHHGRARKPLASISVRVDDGMAGGGRSKHPLDQTRRARAGWEMIR